MSADASARTAHCSAFSRSPHCIGPRSSRTRAVAAVRAPRRGRAPSRRGSGRPPRAAAPGRPGPRPRPRSQRSAVVGVGARRRAAGGRRRQPVAALAAEEGRVGDVEQRLPAAQRRTRARGAGIAGQRGATRSASPSTSAASSARARGRDRARAAPRASSRRPLVAHSTSVRARSPRAPAACASRTSAGQLRAPSSRAIASCASASRGAARRRAPPPARARAPRRRRRAPRSAAPWPRAARGRDRQAVRPSRSPPEGRRSAARQEVDRTGWHVAVTASRWAWGPARGPGAPSRAKPTLPPVRRRLARRARRVRRAMRDARAMSPRRTDRAVAEAAPLEAAKAAAGARGSGSQDPLVGELRRAGLLPLLVLHFLGERAVVWRAAHGAGRRGQRRPHRRQPEHDVPAAARARGAGARGRRVGAPRAPLAALLSPHRRRARPSAGGCRPSWGRAWRTSPPASTSSAASCAGWLMGRVRASVAIAALASEAEALWYDTTRWATFVDGMHHIARAGGRLAAPGGARAVGLAAGRARPRAGARGRLRRARGPDHRRRGREDPRHPARDASRRPRRGSPSRSSSTTRRRSSGPAWRSWTCCSSAARSASRCERTLRRFRTEVAAEREGSI